MDFKDLEELIRIFEASGLSEIEVEEDGRRMRLQKASAAPVVSAPVAVSQTPANASAPEDPTAEPELVLEAGSTTIDSPMVGTFYTAPAPGEPAFVNPGDTVNDGQTVCIVEAMKLMNEVGAKGKVRIEKILVENGQPVEFGQPLFVVKPAG